MNAYAQWKQSRDEAPQAKWSNVAREVSFEPVPGKERKGICIHPQEIRRTPIARRQQYLVLPQY